MAAIRRAWSAIGARRGSSSWNGASRRRDLFGRFTAGFGSFIPGKKQRNGPWACARRSRMERRIREPILIIIQVMYGQREGVKSTKRPRDFHRIRTGCPSAKRNSVADAEKSRKLRVDVPLQKSPNTWHRLAIGRAVYLDPSYEDYGFGFAFMPRTRCQI